MVITPLVVPARLMALVALTLPSLTTENLLTPAICRSQNFDAAALLVSVMFSTYPVKVMPTPFQVCVQLCVGCEVVTVAPVTVRARLVSSHELPDRPPKAPALLYCRVRLAPPGTPPPPPPGGIFHVPSSRK